MTWSYYKQKEWFGYITVCCYHMDSQWNRVWDCSLYQQGVSKVLSALPCHVLAAGGHILVPLVFHKTKGMLWKHTGCLPVREILHWIYKDDFGQKILCLLCHVPPGLPLPLKGSSLFFSHNVQKIVSCYYPNHCHSNPLLDVKKLHLDIPLK